MSDEPSMSSYEEGLADPPKEVFGYPICGGSGVNCCVSARRQKSSNPLAALTPAQLAAIRAVILDVIDDFDPNYDFYADNEVFANKARLDFCDEIAARIIKQATDAPAAGLWEYGRSGEGSGGEMTDKQKLRAEVVDFAERCREKPKRYSQATASILLSLAGALAADSEEQLMDCTAEFARAQIQALTALRN